MTPLRSALALTALVALAACNTAAPPRQPTNVGNSAAAPIVPGTGRIMGGISNAEVQRTTAGPTAGPGAQAPIVPGTGRIMDGTSNAEIQRTRPGRGIQAPIVPGSGQINGGISNAEVDRIGGGPPAR